MSAQFKLRLPSAPTKMFLEMSWLGGATVTSFSAGKYFCRNFAVAALMLEAYEEKVRENEAKQPI